MGAAGVPGRETGAPVPTHPAAVSTRVLLVEDEVTLLRALRINLKVRGYLTTSARTGRAALAEARQRPPDAVILDLGLPDMDGVAVIRDLRGWSRSPVIVLSGRTGPGEMVTALDAGADDYVTKPFHMEELLARLRAALRREDGADPAVRVRIGRSEIDLAAHTAHDGDRQIRLTPTEWRLLEILLRHPGQLISSRRLLAEVWGPGSEQSGHYVRFHMARLRRKLETDPARPRHLLNEPGMGYRYQP